MEYSIAYSKRKTVSLGVTKEAKVVVRAPYRTPVSIVERFIQKKKDWLERALLRQKMKPLYTFLPGDVFLFLGKKYEFEIMDQYSSVVHFDGSKFKISKYKTARSKFLFEDWYKKESLKIFQERVAWYAGRMEVMPKKNTVRNTISQWGSCSASGKIQFCWRLCMAPLFVIDYVVVHELAHMIHKNHSVEFWKTVANFYPQHKEARLYLKFESQTLAW